MPPGPPSPARVADWPLVGRQAELDTIASALVSAGGVVLAGAAGVGKTRLAREVVARADTRRWAPDWVAATRAAASIPLGPFAPLLPVMEGTALSRLGLLQRATRALGERAGDRRLLLAVDDAHLLDDASAALVHQLVLSAAGAVVLTVRTGEALPDPVLALWKDGLAIRLDVPTLSEEEVADLARSVLGGPVEGLTLARLFRATGGNALWVRELVLSGLERGSLEESDGVWSWRGSLAASSRLVDLVDARLARLDDSERDLVEVLAVGEPVGARIVERLASAATLQSLQRRGLVTTARDGRRTSIRLAHPLYGETLRSRMPDQVTRDVHRRLTAALEQAGARRRDDVLAVATGHLETQEGGSPELFTAAARRAQVVSDPGLAEQLARAAIEAGGGLPARLLLAESLTAQGRVAEVEALLAAVEGDICTDRDRSLVAERRALALCFGLGRPGQAEEILTAAEAGVAEAAGRAELAALRSVVVVYSGRPTAGLTIAEGVLADPAATDRALGRAAAPMATALAVAGRVSAVLDVVARLTDAARRFGEENPLAPRQLIASGTLALRLAGRLVEARTMAEDGYREAVAAGWRDASHLFAAALGDGALAEGRVATARRWLREAVALGRGPHGLVLSSSLARLAQVEALAGDVAAAQATLAEALSCRNPALGLFDPLLELARAWVVAASGELTRSAGLALAVASDAQGSGQPAVAVLAALDAARLGEAAGAAPVLLRLAEAVEGPLAEAAADHAAALAADDGAALERSSAAFETMGAGLLAAEAASAAGAAHRRRGRDGPARAAAAHAAVLLERCEGARSPAFVAGDAPKLTRREREVAALAADGLTSAAIAERLYLSVRTVDSHLQHVYTKLGVTSRRELGTLLGRADPAPGRSP